MPNTGTKYPTVRILSKPVTAVIGVAAVVWLGFSWVEADKEVRILCSYFRVGDDIESVFKTLDTGEYLQYDIEGNDSERAIRVDSYYNFRTSNCTIAISDNIVVSSVYTE